MHIANLFLLGVGLILQSLLVVALLRRRLALAIPSFTLLIVFYLLRSACLFVLSTKMERAALGELYDVLSFVDLALQLLVAIQLAVRILRQSGKRAWAYGVKIAALFALAISTAAVIAMSIPARGRLAADRGAAFAAILMLLLVIWAAVVRADWLTQLIAGGFALFGIAGIATGIERSYAITHRQAFAYAVGSYIEVAIYLFAILLWTCRIWRCSRERLASVI